MFLLAKHVCNVLPIHENPADFVAAESNGTVWYYIGYGTSKTGCNQRHACDFQFTLHNISAPGFTFVACDPFTAACQVPSGAFFRKSRTYFPWAAAFIGMPRQLRSSLRRVWRTPRLPVYTISTVHTKFPPTPWPLLLTASVSLSSPVHVAIARCPWTSRATC